MAAAVLMLVPLLYLVVKRVAWLRNRVTRFVSMRTLLAIHVYAGLLGPILGLVHAAHKFRSPLGLSLTGMMLLVVLTGYVGRHLLLRISTAVKGERSRLAALTAEFEEAAAALPIDLAGSRPWWQHMFEREAAEGLTARRVEELARGIADVEHAIRAEEVTRDLFERWLPIHTVTAILLYGLLALHVWSGYYYGFRWLR
ncbi:hypothetical protein [Enterovirga aerilata]|nr:hypothetical protein [Enterovirga sp. DB1703]